MSSLIEDVVAVLAAQIAPAGKVWYGTNTTEPPVYPYITLLRIINGTNITFDGPSDTQDTRMQIDVISTRIGEADVIAKAVQVAMLAAFVIGDINQQDFPLDPEVRAFRISQDFTIWSKDT